MILKEVPSAFQPREKLLREGTENLSNTELIAILIRCGTKNESVLEVANKVLYLLEDINDMRELTLEELTTIKGIGEVKALTLLAAVELGKRIAVKKEKKISFQGPKDIFDYFYPRLSNETQEILYCIYFDIKGKVIAIRELSLGATSQTMIDGKIIFKWAFKYSSSSIILVHNHPSGDPTPSLADLKITAEIVKQSKVIQIEVLDHIIIGESFYSMKLNNKYYKVF